MQNGALAVKIAEWTGEASMTEPRIRRGRGRGRCGCWGGADGCSWKNAAVADQVSSIAETLELRFAQGLRVGGGWRSREYLAVAQQKVEGWTPRCAAVVCGLWCGLGRCWLPRTFLHYATGGEGEAGLSVAQPATALWLDSLGHCDCHFGTFKDRY